MAGQHNASNHRLCVQNDRPCGEDCDVWVIEAAQTRDPNARLVTDRLTPAQVAWLDALHDEED